MTVQYIAPLFAAIKARLEGQLAGQGIAEEEGGDPPDVPVFTEVQATSAHLYCRVDHASMLHGATINGTGDLHRFVLRVTHVVDKSSDLVSDPGAELSRVGGLIQQALSAWKPLERAAQIKFLGMLPAGEEDAKNSSYVLRFETHIYGE